MKFYEFIQDNVTKNIVVYVDMDGVLIEYDPGCFDYDTLRPLQSNLKRIKDLVNQNIKVKILSICKKDVMIKEKIKWFQKYADFLNQEDIILISKENSNLSSKELKSNYLKDNAQGDINILVDDDITIIKYIRENNPNIRVFHVSSWIE